MGTFDNGISKLRQGTVNAFGSLRKVVTKQAESISKPVDVKAAAGTDKTQRADLDFGYGFLGVELSNKKPVTNASEALTTAQAAAPEFGRWQGQYELSDPQQAIKDLGYYTNIQDVAKNMQTPEKNDFYGQEFSQLFA